MILKPHDSIHQKKFIILFKNLQPKRNTAGVIFIFSKVSLSDAEKSILVKGLRFSLPPKKFNYADYWTNFELFYRNIQNLDVLPNGGLDFVKTTIKDAALALLVFKMQMFLKIYPMRN